MSSAFDLLDKGAARLQSPIKGIERQEGSFERIQKCGFPTSENS